MYTCKIEIYNVDDDDDDVYFSIMQAGGYAPMFHENKVMLTFEQ